MNIMKTWLYLMSLDIVKDNENHRKHLHEYKRLMQSKGRILEVTRQFLQTQEKTHARNLKGKHIEIYGDSTLMDLSIKCKNLCKQSNTWKMMYYDSLSYVSSFLMIEDVYIGAMKLTSSFIKNKTNTFKFYIYYKNIISVRSPF